MKMMIKMIEEERRRAGVRVDSIFTENNIDCLWMVTRKYIGGKISSLSLVSVCQYPVEIYVKIKRDEDSLVLRSGDQRIEAQGRGDACRGHSGILKLEEEVLIFVGG